MGKKQNGGKDAAAASSGKQGVAQAGGKTGSAAGKGADGYTLELREGCVALMRFRSRDAMNALLDPISNAIEGTIMNRLGHNFALSNTDKQHLAFRKACGLPKEVRYVIATLEGDAHSIRHEMCHARYYLEPDYKGAVQQVWEGGLSQAQRESVTAFLNRLKYDPVSHVDEFQAYLVTERPNFFGMDLSEAAASLQAYFLPGSWR